MTRRTDQLNRIEAALGRVEGALGKIADALNPVTPGGVAVVAVDAKGARSSAEAAFAGVQALAAVATAKPGTAELAEQVAANTSAVREMRKVVTASTGPQPVVSMPAPPEARLAKGAKGATP